MSQKYCLCDPFSVFYYLSSLLLWSVQQRDFTRTLVRNLPICSKKLKILDEQCFFFSKIRSFITASFTAVYCWYLWSISTTTWWRQLNHTDFGNPLTFNLPPPAHHYLTLFNICFMTIYLHGIMTFPFPSVSVVTNVSMLTCYPKMVNIVDIIPAAC